MGKQQIALAYVEAHKACNPDDWGPLDVLGNGKLDMIYNNMVNDVYGEHRVEDGGHELEISKHDSHNGQSILFTW